MSSSLDLFICIACGTQFHISRSSDKKNCRICDDPRQFVPPSGQSFTTLRELQQDGYENKWQQDTGDNRVWYVRTEPKFAIGQRAILLQTDSGNVLWDLITYLDDATIEKIQSLGGLKAIVISHPHFYTTYVEWAQAFKCPVYVSYEDKVWLDRQDAHDVDRRFIQGPTEEITAGVTAVKLGGHFDGSLVLHWENRLYIADTLVTVPSALYHVERPAGTTSYSFMWSIPNMIPLPPNVIGKMWKALKPFDFTSTHGAFPDMDVRDANVKQRVLESAKIQIRAEGYRSFEALGETD